MIAQIDQAAANLAIATLLGAGIGFERQWRQRMAGLRTNTLVAIGAASFMVFAGLIPGDASPASIAAQVVLFVTLNRAPLGSSINFIPLQGAPQSNPRSFAGVALKVARKARPSFSRDPSRRQNRDRTMRWPRRTSIGTINLPGSVIVCSVSRASASA
jgi:hypothetical protein